MTDSADLDRRPIAARELSVFKRMASQLARAGVSANAISVLGMLCGIAAGAAFLATSRLPGLARAVWVVAAVFVQLRLLANMLDGMVALESGTASKVGELYNEVPDRVSDSAVLIGFGYAAGGNVILGYAAALAAMFTAYVRATGKAAGARHEFCGPMAKQQRMFLVTLVALYCALSPDAWQRPASVGVPAATLALIIVGAVFTAVRRLVRIGAALKRT